MSAKADGSVGIQDRRTIHIQPTHVTNGIDVDHRHDLLHPMDFRAYAPSSQVILHFLGFGVVIRGFDSQRASRTCEDDSERHRSPYELFKQMKATLPYICEALQREIYREQFIYRERIGLDKSLVHILFGEQIKFTNN